MGTPSPRGYDILIRYGVRRVETRLLDILVFLFAVFQRICKRALHVRRDAQFRSGQRKDLVIVNKFKRRFRHHGIRRRLHLWLRLLYRQAADVHVRDHHALVKPGCGKYHIQEIPVLAAGQQYDNHAGEHQQ
ncbi:hypothetical protein SDC9_163435 [bioreactor metagenome]|uniref:Uncharacterized protein n=1 Tax=bioreactor metagenome TaxID=1076179 RepID=A0A645FNU4_9ZZZZ